MGDLENKDKKEESGVPEQKPAQAEDLVAERAVDEVNAILDDKSENDVSASEQSEEGIRKAIAAVPGESDSDRTFSEWFKSTNPDQRRVVYMEMLRRARPLESAWATFQKAQDGDGPDSELDRLDAEYQRLEQESGVSLSALQSKLEGIGSTIGGELLDAPEFTGMKLEEQMEYLEKKVADLARQSREAREAGDKEQADILRDQRRLYFTALRALREATYRPPS